LITDALLTPAPFGFAFTVMSVMDSNTLRMLWERGTRPWLPATLAMVIRFVPEVSGVLFSGQLTDLIFRYFGCVHR